MSLSVLTWNVLHRIHAVNWEEPAIRAWDDERARMASIAEWIAQIDADIVCLQEVSGDQLAMLRGGTIHNFAYPRVPSYRRKPEPAALSDPREHLAILVRAPGSRKIAATAFASDRGKGFLALELADGPRVINTHVTYGDKHTAQCAALIAAASNATRTILCGDFNADHAVCSANLVPLKHAPLADSPLHTRPRQNPTEKSQDIDHVFTQNLEVSSAEILDGEGRSDHNPVRVRLSIK